MNSVRETRFILWHFLHMHIIFVYIYVVYYMLLAGRFYNIQANEVATLWKFAHAIVYLIIQTSCIEM